jgi:actin-related protein
VVDIGEDTTTVTPVFDGYRICPQAVQQNHFGGRHLTEYMVKLLKEVGINWSRPYEYGIAKDIK